VSYFGRLFNVMMEFRKMEIMTSKTLNEQPAIKMQRLSGMDADEQQKELNGLSK
jgi:hypothetical protein